MKPPQRLGLSVIKKHFMIFLARKTDFLIVSIIGIVFGAAAVVVLQNINPSFWTLSFSSAALMISVFFLFANFALWIGNVLGTLNRVIWQFTKYGAAGSLSAALDAGTLNFLSLVFKVYSGPWIAAFNVLSVSLALTNSYFLNKFWVFESQHPVHAREIVKFLGVNFVTIILNTIIVYTVTTFYAPPGNITPELWENIAKTFAIPVSMIVNFCGFRFFVFTHKHEHFNR